MHSLDLLIVICAVGCGLVAGFFFAFSVCVMAALKKLPAAQGIAAMQSINVVVINPWFLSAFFGTALACLLAIAASVSQWHDPRAPYWLAAGLLYIFGAIAVTMLCNVPRNNALAAVAASSPEAATLWSEYLSSWTAWNHVRTVTASIAAALFTIAVGLPP
jgi:uncharacterized membrane protein